MKGTITIKKQKYLLNLPDKITLLPTIRFIPLTTVAYKVPPAITILTIYPTEEDITTLIQVFNSGNPIVPIEVQGTTLATTLALSIKHLECRSPNDFEESTATILLAGPDKMSIEPIVIEEKGGSTGSETT
jgi:hypothetical protein